MLKKALFRFYKKNHYTGIFRLQKYILKSYQLSLALKHTHIHIDTLTSLTLPARRQQTVILFNLKPLRFRGHVNLLTQLQKANTKQTANNGRNAFNVTVFH